mmetsp:Transcript_39901/g.86403  ORF Transcript_39901/g.86403 Transcript_39901/m.86403 type:complete len:264 (+) Transcript_39901:951-1742(+)
MVLLHRRPRLISIGHITGHWVAIFRGRRSITPAARVRHGVAKVQEEGRGSLYHFLHPSHRLVVEDIDGVVVAFGVFHTSLSAGRGRMYVCRQLEIQLLHSTVNLLGIHVVAQGLIYLSHEDLKALLQRRCQGCHFAEGARAVASLSEQLRHQRQIGRAGVQHLAIETQIPKPAAVSSCEEGSAAGSTNGVASIGLSKDEALPTEAIQVGCGDPAMGRLGRIESHLAPAQVISHDPNHIGPCSTASYRQQQQSHGMRHGNAARS